MNKSWFPSRTRFQPRIQQGNPNTPAVVTRPSLSRYNVDVLQAMEQELRLESRVVYAETIVKVLDFIGEKPLEKGE